jgi:hypothetical protein
LTRLTRSLKNAELIGTAVCREADPGPPLALKFPESIENRAQALISEWVEEEAPEPEVELDPVNDPIVPVSTYPDSDWEREIKSIVVREPKIFSDKEQRSRIASLLEMLDAEKPEPKPHRWKSPRTGCRTLNLSFPTTMNSWRPISVTSSLPGRSC